MREEKKLNRSSIIIEPSSGNTGIALAAIAAAKRYKAVIVAPKKTSEEKINTMKAFGAKVIIAPNVPYGNENHYITIANDLLKTHKNAVIINQYHNRYNSLAHYSTLAPEIEAQCDENLAMIVLGLGTCGTASGLGLFFKDRDIKIVAADPVGSIFSSNHPPSDYLIEGIGDDFIPDLFDSELIDRFISVSDKEAFQTARDCAVKTAIFVGGASGAILAATKIAAKDLEEDQTCVAILSDSGRNYLTKFFNDEWLKNHSLDFSVREQ